MEAYANKGGDSSVAAYEIGNDGIRVRFQDGAVYLYSYGKPGSHHVEQMKTLARNGVGLNSYINRNVRKEYAARE